jgi:hypothetical protein
MAELRDRMSTSAAAVVGGVVAGVIFFVLILNGQLTLLRHDFVGGFYDLQAHSLLRGHLDVPAKGLGLEAFFVGGKTYMYHGPWPAVIRLPIAAVTHRLDGRLTQISMLIAFAIALIFTYRLCCRVRPLVRGDEPVTRAEQWATGAFVLVVGAGSVLMFLASVAWVYHEAELWGAALAIAAFDFIVAYTTAPTRQNLVLASLFSTLAIMSRGSVGAGPVAALGIIFLASLWRRTHEGFGLARVPRSIGEWRRLGIAVAVPVVLYAGVNYAKFGSLLSVPANRQILYKNPARAAALAANGNSLFGVKFVPTTLVQFLRPDGLRITSLFPWISFPAPAHVFAGAKFDTIDLSASLTASTPALIVLAVIGLVGVLRPRVTGGPTLASLRGPVLGAVASTGAALGIAFIAERYLSDFVPLLVLLGAAGLHLVIARTSAGVVRRVTSRVVWGGLIALAVFSVWANVGLAVLYQRTLAPTVATSTSIASFVRLQRAVHRYVPGGSMPNIRHGPTLPKQPGPLQTIFVLDGCRGVYWSGGDAWRGIERTRSTGRWRLQASFAAEPAGAWQPIFVTGQPGEGTFIAARVQGDRVVIGFRAEPNEQWLESSPERFTPGRTTNVDLVYDAKFGKVEVRLDGHKVVDLPYFLRNAENVTIGRSDIGGPVVPRFTGRIAELPDQPTLCTLLTG